MKTVVVTATIAAASVSTMFSDLKSDVGIDDSKTACDLTQLAIVYGSGFAFWEVLSWVADKSCGLSTNLAKVAAAVAAIVMMVNWPDCVYERRHDYSVRRCRETVVFFGGSPVRSTPPSPGAERRHLRHVLDEFPKHL